MRSQRHYGISHPSELVCLPLPKFSHVCSVSTSASDRLERLVSEMTYNVLMGTLNPTHSLIQLYMLLGLI